MLRDLGEKPQQGLLQPDEDVPKLRGDGEEEEVLEAELYKTKRESLIIGEKYKTSPCSLGTSSSGCKKPCWGFSPRSWSIRRKVSRLLIYKTSTLHMEVN